MSRLDIPFNLDLLIIDEKASMLMRPVTSLDPFVGATKNFNPNGLYSTEIFGVVGTPARYAKYSFIDLKVKIIHPIIYRALGQIKSLYHDVIARREFAVWDPELKDLVKSNVAEGQTGFEFFCEYLPRIVFPNNDSEARQMAVGIMEKYRASALMSRVLIIPAGFREFDMDEDGRESSSEINDFYYRLLTTSNTVNASTLKGSPEAYDTQRVTMQNALMDLYDLFTTIIEGKNNLLMGKTAGRKIFNGTRNVITANSETIAELGKPRNVQMNDSLVGLFQFAKAVLPHTLARMRDGWISECFSAPGAPVNLCDKKTLQSVSVQLRADQYSKWLSVEGLEKQLTYFREETIRHNPIDVEGHYLGLVYRGPDGTFAFIHGIDELPEGRLAEHCTPITMTDLIYRSLYRVARRFKGFLTRYPITGIGSIYPSNSYLKTTIKSETRVELNPMDWRPYGDEYVAYEYPVLGSPFFNSLSPNPVKLKRLGADFDGDTGSYTIVYSENAIAEVDRHFKKKKTYVGTDGRLIDSLSDDVIDFVLANLTGN